MKTYSICIGYHTAMEPCSAWLYLSRDKVINLVLLKLFSLNVEENCNVMEFRWEELQILNIWSIKPSMPFRKMKYVDFTILRENGLSNWDPTSLSRLYPVSGLASQLN
jgi:hypothetical protein